MRLATLPDAAQRHGRERADWFTMFKQMDDDASGRISYDELRRGVREQLHLPKAEMPEARLRSLWKALDDDASGWISAGEFGRFMRKGEAEGQAARIRAARANVDRRRQLAQEEQKQAMDALVSPGRRARPAEPVSAFRRRSPPDPFPTRIPAPRSPSCPAIPRTVATPRRPQVGRDVTDRLASVETASEAEVLQLSQLFNATLHAHAATRQLGWFKFFTHMDDDGSGRIAYEELARGVRDVLGLKRAQLPEPRLQSLWKALDDDASGWISCGEFLRFTKKGEGDHRGGVPPPASRSSSSSASRSGGARGEEDKWAQTATRRGGDAAEDRGGDAPARGATGKEGQRAAGLGVSLPAIGDAGRSTTFVTSGGY